MDHALQELSFWIAMAGTVAFAVSAVLSVAHLKVDLFAAVVLGIITAIGGGTVRDVVLDAPVFWGSDTSYLWVAVGASVAAFYGSSLFSRRHLQSLFLYVDGLAVAMFAIQATHKVWKLDFGLPIGPIMLGVVTAIGGGLIRDVLVQRQTLLLSRELYAIPVLVGCTAFVGILELAPQWRFSGSIACFLLIFGIRAAAIHWKLHVPEWATMGTRHQATAKDQ